MKKNRTVPFFVLFFILPVNAFSFTYLGSVEGIGDPVLSVSAKTLSMGNCSTASGDIGASVFYNPANMAQTERPAAVLGLGLYPIKETIETDDEITAYSSANYYELSSMGFIYPVHPNLLVGAGRRPVMDLKYKHSRSIYSSGEITGTVDFDVAGAMTETSVSAAGRFVYGINAGLRYSIITGGGDLDSQVVSVESEKAVVRGNRELVGASWAFGVTWEAKKDVMDIAFAWSPPYKVENSWSTRIQTYTWTGAQWSDVPVSETAEGKIEYNFPSHAGIGIRYEFAQQSRSALCVDIVRTLWSRFKYMEKEYSSSSAYNKKEDPGYRDTFMIGVGLEHYVGADTILRYGFTHLPHYSRTSADLTMFTAGVGFPAAANLTMDIAGAYGKRNFYGKNIFFTQEQMVDERFAKLLVSWEWSF